MRGIVQQVTIPDNEQVYQRAIEEAQIALGRAVAARLGRDASFGDREVALLAAANDRCRVELEAALQQAADALPDRVQIDGRVYTRHEGGAAAYTVSVARCTCAARRIAERGSALGRRSCPWNSPRG